MREWKISANAFDDSRQRYILYASEVDKADCIHSRECYLHYIQNIVTNCPLHWFELCGSGEILNACPKYIGLSHGKISGFSFYHQWNKPNPCIDTGYWKKMNQTYDTIIYAYIRRATWVEWYMQTELINFWWNNYSIEIYCWVREWGIFSKYGKWKNTNKIHNQLSAIGDDNTVST